MDLEPVPIEHSCLGCKRYFLLHEILPLETMTIEFKNYSVPIRESRLKAVLLKTIVAFINTKGGIIFIGVDDSTGKVEGLPLGRKQMDEFRLFIKCMLEKVTPSVDIVKEEEVSVEFIPVLEGKERNFYGRYVIKFIVRQGDPSKLYCISEKVNSSDYKEIELIFAYRRHNLGGVQEIKGKKVIQEIYEKARNPYNVYETFHKNCNPHPILPALAERPKIQALTRIFADQEDSGDSSQRQSSSQRSKSKRSLSQASENGTIIDKISDLNSTILKEEQSDFKEKKTQKENKNPFKSADESGCVAYFENVRDSSIYKMMNYLKNSTPAKFALEIQDENGIVCVRMSSKEDRDGLIEQMARDPYKRLLNQFGHNGRVNILKNLSHKPVRFEPKEREKSPNLETEVRKSSYRLLFCNYVKNLENSVENYLKNSININIRRKMGKVKDGIELIFESKRDMSHVYDLCLNPPHNRLLGQFWAKGAIKIQKFERRMTEKLDSGKDEKSPQKKVKLELDSRSVPQLMDAIDRIQEEPKPNKHSDIDSFQLIASSLEPSEVSKLSNYLVNNMFYNIQKKIYSSKERYYIRIVFNNTQDCRDFLGYCMLEQHRYMLSQFCCGTKMFRIGVPSETLVVSPYSDAIKEDLKRLIMKVLGLNAIKKSSMKDVDKTKVWVLTLIDPSKILEYYEKLESVMRKEGFYINNEWYRFKVFLDYL